VALVLFLRGVNVGGRRIFRPSALAAELAHLGAINIGAAGTFVIRGRISREGLRAELTRRLPFVTGMVICDGRDILKLTTRSRFAGAASRPGTVRFVSVLVDRPLATPALPLQMPARGRWLLKILARDGRFVWGVYRRDVKVIGYLGKLDRLFGVPVTTRNWNTITAIAKALTGD
jgi:uncharacterized protein (DUF1697 family)